ncbi:MAG: hypothetical protein KDC82_00760, partial [Bacteroidetes bacterium]|nr:hypothetical protein [Bacteroidota bacterium]
MIVSDNKYKDQFALLNKKENSLEAKAFARFEKMGLPTRKSEVYRYSNLSYFKNLSPSINGNIPHKIPDYFSHDYLKEKNVLVTINGIFSESLSTYEEE